MAFVVNTLLVLVTVLALAYPAPGCCTKVVLWFEGERHSLPCPVAGHGHGSDDDIEWHYNDSSLLTEENGRLTVSRVSLSLNNTVLRCVGPKGVFEYRVQVEESLPRVKSVHLEDKHLCWGQPQTIADIIAYHINSHTGVYSARTTETCVTLEDMPEFLECLACGGCGVNITVEFWEDGRKRNGSTKTLQLAPDSKVSVVNDSVRPVIINDTTTNISLNLNEPVCFLSAHFNGMLIPANWRIVDSNYTEVSLLLTNLTEGQTGSLNLQAVCGNHTFNLSVPINLSSVITDGATTSTSSTELEGNVTELHIAAPVSVVLTLLVLAAAGGVAVIVVVIYLWRRKGKKGDQDITSTEDTTESLDPPKERDRSSSLHSYQSIPDTNTETLDADTSYEVPANVAVGQQESQPLLATRSAGEESAVDNIQGMNGEVQPFSITSAPVEYTAIQMGLEYSEIQQLNAPCESVSAASSPCTPVHCSDMAFPSHCLVSPSLRSSAAGIPVAENLRVNTSLPPHYNNTVQGSSVEEDHHNDKMMETTPRAVAISMEHLETSVHQTTAFSSDEGVAASPPTTPIDCSDTTLFPFHCRVSPSVGSSYGPSPPASNLPADSSLVQSCSVKKDQHNSEKPEYVSLPKNTSSTTLQQLASCKADVN